MGFSTMKSFLPCSVVGLFFSTFLMLFRLHSDSINVLNVDLYYINNSQVYGGLCLLNGKTHF